MSYVDGILIFERRSRVVSGSRRHDGRPDPDALLQTVKDQSPGGKGRLKIFFGAAPGVGKTFAMLEAAHRELRAGKDVVVGYIEPHQRPETIALLEGLPSIPPKSISHRGVSLAELDLEAALARRPQLLLVDELAHTNAPGSSNEKRWQDVEYLLRAGIDVYSTLNVQHLESTNDLVAAATRVTVRETIPDTVFDEAWEIELVDLPPDDLIARLQSGKIYLPDQARLAQEFFFQKANLVALRELALRRTAERVDRQLEDYKRAQALPSVWPSREKLVVCVGPSPFSVKLVRATRRMAASLRCRWIAVHLDALGRQGISSRGNERIKRNLRLAERLGAETAVLTASDLVGELIRFAHEQHITKIIVGKPSQPRWKELLRGSFVYSLTKRCGDIDIYVISGDAAQPEEPPSARQSAAPDPAGYFAAILGVAICTAISWLLWQHINPINLVMIYLLGVVAISSRYRRGPATLSAFLSVATFDFLFVPPYWTFAVSDGQYLLTFGVMLLTGLVVTNLTLRLRSQTDVLREREQRTARLLSFSKRIGQCHTTEEVLQVATRRLGEAISGKVSIVLSQQIDARGPSLAERPAAGYDFEVDDALRGVATWAFEHNEAAGHGTSVLSAARATFYPIASGDRRLGVVGIQGGDGSPLEEAERKQILEAFVDILASVLDRANLSRVAEEARLEAETERLRNTLLSSVSHDLRTPLAVIEGASTTLLETESVIDERVKRSLLETIVSEGEYLNRLVGNLLDATRLEGGNVSLSKEWQSVEELVGSVVNRQQRLLAERGISIRIEPDLPLVLADGPLIHQVLLNLVENAVKFSPAGSPIELEALSVDGGIELRISDRGRGIAAEELPHLFDKFFRGRTASGRAGAGLGLAVAKGVVHLHGGRIAAENREGGGAVFRVWLPCETLQPEIVSEGPV